MDLLPQAGILRVHVGDLQTLPAQLYLSEPRASWKRVLGGQRKLARIDVHRAPKVLGGQNECRSSRPPLVTLRQYSHGRIEVHSGPCAGSLSVRGRPLLCACDCCRQAPSTFTAPCSPAPLLQSTPLGWDVLDSEGPSPVPGAELALTNGGCVRCTVAHVGLPHGRLKGAGQVKEEENKESDVQHFLGIDFFFVCPKLPHPFPPGSASPPTPQVSETAVTSLFPLYLSHPYLLPTLNYSKALRRMPLIPPFHPASPIWEPLTQSPAMVFYGHPCPGISSFYRKTVYWLSAFPRPSSVRALPRHGFRSPLSRSRSRILFDLNHISPSGTRGRVLVPRET